MVYQPLPDAVNKAFSRPVQFPFPERCIPYNGFRADIIHHFIVPDPVQEKAPGKFDTGIIIADTDKGIGIGTQVKTAGTVPE
jgi:hypothetical protein